MRNQKLLLGLGILAANVMVMNTAQADRRTGLSGNLLIQDPDDLFPFPQLILQHRNMIRLDYGGPAGSPAAAPGAAGAAIGANGNGVLTLGNEDMALAISLHRGDVLSPDVVGQGQELQWLAGVQNPFGSTSIATGEGAFNAPALPSQGAAAVTGAVLPATVLDLGFAMPMGNDAFGVRFAFGRGVQAVTNDGDTQKGTNNFIALQAGYSLMPEDGLKLDTSVTLAYGHAKSTAANGDDVNAGNEIRLGALARGYLPFNDVVDLGFLGNLSLDNEHTSNDPADASSNDFGFNLMAAAGPAINLDRAKVAAYGGLMLGFGFNEPNSEADDDEVNRVQFAAPVVNMATEVQLLDWLYARTGAQYVWGLDRRGYKNGAGDDASDKVTAGTFGWTAGLGVTKNNFFLDGVVTNGFVTNGPAFIGGPGAGFLAMASLTYKFGDVFSDGELGGEEAPAAAEPEATEAPAQESAAPAVDGTATGGAAAGDGSVNAGGTVGGSIGTP